jgi:hypothetical protein
MSLCFASPRFRVTPSPFALRIVAKVTELTSLCDALESQLKTAESASTYPAHVVCDWLGNSQAVAQKHYLHTTDEHFEQATKAAHKAAQYLSESGENGGTEPQPELVKTKENHISPANTEENEWAMRDSNPRHPLCKSGALTN